MSSAYLDTCLVSALVKRDIEERELNALVEILLRFERAELALVCSDAVEDELAKIPSDDRRPHLQQLRVFERIPRLAPGGITRLSPMGMPAPNPYRALWDKLQALLPDNDDAEHVFITWTNRIDYLVTVDSRTMLRHKTAVQALCGVWLVLPTEFLDALPIN